MLTVKVLTEVPSSKATAQRRMNGTRRRPLFRRSTVRRTAWGRLATAPSLRGANAPSYGNLKRKVVVGAGRSSPQDESIGARAPRHSLAVQVFEQRDHELAAEAGQVLETGDVEARAGGPTAPDFILERFQPRPLDEGI